MRRSHALSPEIQKDLSLPLVCSPLPLAGEGRG
ncbi:hypothetical protein CBM2634_B160007 [Cupriavidus taiwanensis]|uniref:Uncharacterized protein n=1 Tax=Cupriavidus taiwanensis TaxID=164546 RepID=A0A375J6C8_9BURK|nr:hypothetical protein CBM2634_B160007 [Cupriavidus taiwanensis]